MPCIQQADCHGDGVEYNATIRGTSPHSIGRIVVGGRREPRRVEVAVDRPFPPHQPSRIRFEAERPIDPRRGRIPGRKEDDPAAGSIEPFQQRPADGRREPSAAPLGVGVDLAEGRDARLTSRGRRPGRRDDRAVDLRPGEVVAGGVLQQPLGGDGHEEVRLVVDPERTFEEPRQPHSGFDRERGFAAPDRRGPASANVHQPTFRSAPGAVVDAARPGG